MDKLAYTSIPVRGYCISPQSVQGLKKEGYGPHAVISHLKEFYAVCKDKE